MSVASDSATTLAPSATTASGVSPALQAGLAVLCVFLFLVVVGIGLLIFCYRRRGRILRERARAQAAEIARKQQHAQSEAYHIRTQSRLESEGPYVPAVFTTSQIGGSSGNNNNTTLLGKSGSGNNNSKYAITDRKGGVSSSGSGFSNGEMRGVSNGGMMNGGSLNGTKTLAAIVDPSLNEYSKSMLHNERYVGEEKVESHRRERRKNDGPQHSRSKGKKKKKKEDKNVRKSVSLTDLSEIDHEFWAEKRSDLPADTAEKSDSHGKKGAGSKRRNKYVMQSMSLTDFTTIKDIEEEDEDEDEGEVAIQQHHKQQASDQKSMAGKTLDKYTVLPPTNPDTKDNEFEGKKHVVNIVTGSNQVADEKAVSNGRRWSRSASICSAHDDADEQPRLTQTLPSVDSNLAAVVAAGGRLNRRRPFSASLVRTMPNGDDGGTADGKLKKRRPHSASMAIRKESVATERDRERYRMDSEGEKERAKYWVDGEGGDGQKDRKRHHHRRHKDESEEERHRRHKHRHKGNRHDDDSDSHRHRSESKERKHKHHHHKDRPEKSLPPLKGQTLPPLTGQNLPPLRGLGGLNQTYSGAMDNSKRGGDSDTSSRQQQDSSRNRGQSHDDSMTDVTNDSGSSSRTPKTMETAAATTKPPKAAPTMTASPPKPLSETMPAGLLDVISQVSGQLEEKEQEKRAKRERHRERRKHGGDRGKHHSRERSRSHHRREKTDKEKRTEHDQVKDRQSEKDSGKEGNDADDNRLLVKVSYKSDKHEPDSHVNDAFAGDEDVMMDVPVDLSGEEMLI